MIERPTPMGGGFSALSRRLREGGAEATVSDTAAWEGLLDAAAHFLAVGNEENNSSSFALPIAGDC